MGVALAVCIAVICLLVIKIFMMKKSDVYNNILRLYGGKTV